VICLDTNYLIGGLVSGSQEGKKLAGWAQAGEGLLTPMSAWYEFLCGPVTPAQVQAMRAFLVDIVPFDEPQALVAAKLFNTAGRKRVLRVDAMIAATALVARAPLATQNQADFALFAGSGLKFA
jgi:predicted nucleic acid-binding protein